MSLGCAICMESFGQPVKKENEGAASKSEKQVIVATKCGHLYHSFCLNKWFEKKSGQKAAWTRQACPNCQNALTVATDVFRIFPTNVDDGIPQADKEFVAKAAAANKELQTRLEISFIQTRKLQQDSEFNKKKVDEAFEKLKREKFRASKIQAEFMKLKKENDELKTLIVDQSRLLAGPSSNTGGPPFLPPHSQAVQARFRNDMAYGVPGRPAIAPRFQKNSDHFRNEAEARNPGKVNEEEEEDEEEFMKNLLSSEENKSNKTRPTNGITNDMRRMNFKGDAGGGGDAGGSRRSSGDELIESLFNQIGKRNNGEDLSDEEEGDDDDEEEEEEEDEDNAMPANDFIETLLNEDGKSENNGKANGYSAAAERGMMRKESSGSENGSSTGYYPFTNPSPSMVFSNKKYPVKKKIMREGQLYGKYLCQKCNAKWGNSKSYKGQSQTCIVCSSEVFPYKLEPIIVKK